MDVVAFLIAEPQSTEVEEPAETGFDNVSVFSKPTAMLSISLCDKRFNPSATKCVSDFVFRVVRSVAQEFIRSLTTAPFGRLDRRNCIDNRYGCLGIVKVSSGVEDSQRSSLPVGYQVTLRAILASIRWIRPGLRPPKTARTLQLSTADVLQSIASASPSSSRNSRQIFFHTSASCQSRRRRQQVIPDPHSISAGKYSHGVPVLKTKRIPVRAARSGTRGRPPFGFGGSGGSSGAIRSQSSSGNKGLAILSSLTWQYRKWT